MESWIERMKPVYLMASTPAGQRKFPPSPCSFLSFCSGFSLETPVDRSAPPNGYALLQKVLVPLARKHHLALALKVLST